MHLTIMNVTAQLLACAACGALAALPFRTLDSSLPLWLALAPAFWCAARAATRRRAALCGFAFALSWTLSAFSFMWSCAFEGALAVSLYTALIYTAAIAGIAALSRRGGAAAVFGAAALWTLVEIARSTVPILYFPWLLLGHASLYCENLRQAADIFGVYGLSFLIAACNAWLAFGLPAWLPEHFRAPQTMNRKTSWRCASLLCALVLGTWAYGVERIERLKPRLKSGATIGVIQGNVSTKLGRSLKDLDDQTARHLELHRRVIREIRDSEGAPPALVCWAETMVPGDMYEQRWGAAFRKQIALSGVPTLAGSNAGEPGNDKREPEDELTHNAAFLFDASGREIMRYYKRRLVAFGEYIPGSRRFSALKMLRSVTRDDYIPGVARSPVQAVGGYNIALDLCIEDAHPALAREAAFDGADTLINLTNDGWFYGTFGPRAHLQTAAWRAIETRRPLLRVTNTGCTAAVDPLGNISLVVPLEQEATGAVKLQRIDGGGSLIVTPYMRLGEFWSAVFFALLLLASLALTHKAAKLSAT